MREYKWHYLSIVIGVAAAVLMLAAMISASNAGSIYATPDVSHWYGSLRQPDAPAVSCCGEADAYYADKVDTCKPADAKHYYQDPMEFLNDCALVAIITDTRPDVRRLPIGFTVVRQHIPVGTRIPIMKEKIRKYPSRNPTGHNIVFVSPSYFTAYCWEPQALF